MTKKINLFFELLLILILLISCSGSIETGTGTVAADSAAATGSAAEPGTEPAAESETESATVPATEPVTEPATEPETEPAAITAIKLNASELTLEQGNSVFLEATVTPAGAENKNMTWSSSDNTVADVDGSGKVTAVGPGKAVITAKTDNGIEAVCALTVNKKIIPVKKVTLDRTALELTEGESYTFSPMVSPADADDKQVSLASDNNAVVTVSGFRITAVGAGSAVISAKASDGNGASAVCTVTVRAVPVSDAEKPAETEPPYDEENDQSLPKTAKPVYSAQSIIKNGTICITGTCEEGAQITVKGEKIPEFTVMPQEKRFFFSVSLKYDQTDTLSITAKAPGKRTSDATTIDVKYAKGGVDVTVGRISQLHYPMTLNDYYGTNLFNDSQLKAVEKQAERRLAKVREKSGVDTKLIYLVAPNCLTIYPETARDEWTAKKKSDDSRRQQFIRMMKERNDPDIIVIDIVDYMLQNKDKGKLYYQTDTHWNTLGAYFGYYKLMEAIAVDFPEAAPYELDKFDVKAIRQEGGDLVRFLGINPSQGSETTYSCTLRGKSQATVKSDDGAIPSSSFILSTVDNEALPTAVVMRDSFGYSIQKFLFEHFEKLTYTPQSCGFAKALTYVADAKPDYFIHILIERYIDQLLGE